MPLAIDAASFPHIIDQVLDSVIYDRDYPLGPLDAMEMRAVCRQWYSKINNSLFDLASISDTYDYGMMSAPATGALFFVMSKENGDHMRDMADSPLFSGSLLVTATTRVLDVQTELAHNFVIKDLFPRLTALRFDRVCHRTPFSVPEIVLRYDNKSHLETLFAMGPHSVTKTIVLLPLHDLCLVHGLGAVTRNLIPTSKLNALIIFCPEGPSDQIDAIVSTVVQLAANFPSLTITFIPPRARKGGGTRDFNCLWTSVKDEVYPAISLLPNKIENILFLKIDEYVALVGKEQYDLHAFKHINLLLMDSI